MRRTIVTTFTEWYNMGQDGQSYVIVITLFIHLLHFSNKEGSRTCIFDVNAINYLSRMGEPMFILVYQIGVKGICPRRVPPPPPLKHETSFLEVLSTRKKICPNSILSLLPEMNVST